MCVCVPRPMKIVTFPQKTVRPPNWLLIFCWKRKHSDKNHGNRLGFSSAKSYKNNGKPWKSSRILRVKPKRSSEVSHVSKCSSFFVIFLFFFSFSFIFHLHFFISIFHFFFAKLRVARSTLQTRKLWLSRLTVTLVTLACVSFLFVFLFVFFDGKKWKMKKIKK